AFIGGLPFEIDEEKLRESVEEKFGKVLWIEVVRERVRITDTGSLSLAENMRNFGNHHSLFKKCAFVEFSEKSCYDNAINQRTFTFNGMQLRIVKALAPK
ncbi:6700_t:CDS:1, partial [Acaulospora morrowiae]